MSEASKLAELEGIYTVVNGPGYFDAWRVTAIGDSDPHVRVHLSEPGRRQSDWIKLATTGAEITGRSEAGGVRLRQPHGIQTAVVVEARGINGEGKQRLLAATIAAIALGESIAAEDDFDVAYPAYPLIDVAKSSQLLAPDHRVRLVTTTDISRDPVGTLLRSTGVEDFITSGGVTSRSTVGYEMSLGVTTDRLDEAALEQMAINMAALAFGISAGEFAA
jgi:hypothetical protein